DGTEIDRWNANSTNGNNNVASNASFRTRTIASQQLAAGDVITVTGTTNAGEFARFDYIEFIPRSTTPSSSGTGEGVITTTEVAPSATTQAAINFEQTYQAEDATLDRASIKSGIANADGEYAHLWKTTASSASDGIEWTIDVPVAGFYQLDWKYGLSEKYAANAPLDLIVNGDRSETLEFSNTGRWLNWETTSRTVYLEAGANTIRLEGTGFGSANIDWMKVTGVSD
ncbi:MAG: CBM35 domain-containing protein, partial [Synechococcus sp.]